MEDDADTAFRMENMSSPGFIFVPLPWRVVLLTGVSILCWASNLQFLHLMGIDTAYVLGMHSHTNAQYSIPFSPTSTFGSTTSINSRRLYTGVYKLLGAYAAWTFSCWLLFRVLCRGDAQIIDQYKIVPEICVVGILVALVCPLNVLRKRERRLFLQGLHRCFFSPINQPIHFSDVVLADIFTSFAKVIGDLWISACMLAPWGSLRSLPVDEGWLQWMVPCLMSLPYVVRFRQCLVEFLCTTQHSNNKALFNAIKYSTAFPVIFLSAAQRLVVSELVAEKGTQIAKTPWHGEHQLFRLWLLAVAVNSGYSFWWDVTNDWGLSLFKSNSGDAQSSPSRTSISSQPPKSESSETLSLSHDEDEGLGGASQTSWSPQHYPWGLRPVLLFNDPIVYYIAISVNLVLRLIWSLKLSSHLHAIAELESGVFLMEALELIRRWVWVFFRIEWEAIRKGAPTVGDDEADRAIPSWNPREVHELR